VQVRLGCVFIIETEHFGESGLVGEQLHGKGGDDVARAVFRSFIMKLMIIEEFINDEFLKTGSIVYWIFPLPWTFKIMIKEGKTRS
jgi:hypothetical protein